MLGLNAGIGRAVEKATTLEQQNTTLRLEVSRLGSGDRIAQEAQQLGLVMPNAGEVRYTDVTPADAAHAAKTMKPADPDLAAQAKAAVEAGVGTGAIALAPESAETAPGADARAARPPIRPRPRRHRAAAATTTATAQPQQPAVARAAAAAAAAAGARRPGAAAGARGPAAAGDRTGGDAGRRRRRDPGGLGPVGLTQRRIGLLFAVFLVLLSLAVLRAGWARPRQRRHPQERRRDASRSSTSPCPRSAGRSPTAPATELAVSEPANDISATPYLVKDPRGRRRARADPRRAGGRPARKLTEHTGFVYLARKLPSARAAQVRKLGIPGIDLTPASRREYPRDWLASQVLGTVHRRRGRRGPRVRARSRRCTARTASGASCATRSASRSDQRHDAASPGTTSADARRARSRTRPRRSWRRRRRPTGPRAPPRS